MEITSLKYVELKKKDKKKVEYGFCHMSLLSTKRPTTFRLSNVFLS